MNLLLAVTGSISVYKTYDLVRLLVKEGHTVKVVATIGAQKFIKLETYLYLGASEVFSHNDDFNLSTGENGVRHIDLLKWADRMIIAPASANTIAKFANGFCDDLLSSIFLARKETPCFIFPAMNSGMLDNAATQRNISLLKELTNIYVHPTIAGELACGDIGLGKLANIDSISLISLHTNFIKSNRKVVITTGATIAPLDPVRYLTNPSSGITGFEIAKEFIQNGDEVVLIYGANCIPTILDLEMIPNVRIIEAKTTHKMLEVATQEFKDCDIYISAAAICDIEFELEHQKLKKTFLKDFIKIDKAPDVLANILKLRKNQTIVSFAAETSKDKSIFQEKWNRKKVNLLIGNMVHSGHNQEKVGFGTNENEYFFIQDGEIKESKFLTKQKLAQQIYQFLN